MPVQNKYDMLHADGSNEATNALLIQGGGQASNTMLRVDMMGKKVLILAAAVLAPATSVSNLLSGHPNLLNANNNGDQHHPQAKGTCRHVMLDAEHYSHGTRTVCHRAPAMFTLPLPS